MGSHCLPVTLFHSVGRCLDHWSDKFQVDGGGMLTIYDSGQADEGRYECVAQNPLFSVAADTCLTVTDGYL